MDWKEFLEKNREHLDRYKEQGGYERKFVEVVLSRVPTLDPAKITCQRHLMDDDEGNLFIDFTYSEGKNVRLAIEVDGYNKVPGQKEGMTHNQFVRFQSRGNAIVGQGWTLLRYATREVNRRPQRCANEIERNIAYLRAVAKELDQATTARQVTTELQKQVLIAERDRATGQAQRDSLLAELGSTRQSVVNLQAALSAARSTGDQSTIDRYERAIRESTERSSSLARQLDSKIAEVHRLRQIAAAVASESAGISRVELRELEDL